MLGTRQGKRFVSLRVLAAGVVGGLSIISPQRTPAQDAQAVMFSLEAILGERIVRVEEDWELVLNVPNGNVQSPQFHTVMSPSGDLNSYYGQVLWNYWDVPEFRAGGLQLQGWDGETLSRTRSFDLGPLSTNAETVTWTQTLEIDTGNDVLYFGVSAGQSSTWGYFGGTNVRIGRSWQLDDLNSYSTEFSAANSCITYGSNRVDRVRILQVRRYSSSGVCYVDSTPRTVFELND